MTTARSRPARRAADDTAAAANRRRAAVLVAQVVAAITIAVTVVGLALGHGLLGLFFGLLAAGAAVAVAVRGAAAAVLTAVGGRPADPDEHARLLNLVEGLCLSAGLAQPSVLVVDDPGANACAVGLAAGGTTLLVTSGLVSSLTRVELEGVLARELGLLRSGGTALATVAVGLVARPGTLLTRVAPRQGPLVVSRLLRRTLGPGREAGADFAGVTLTRYPPGLATALEKVVSASTVRSAPGWSGPLWLADPSSRTAGPGALPSGTLRLEVHPPIQDRIQALKEL